MFRSFGNEKSEALISFAISALMIFISAVTIISSIPFFAAAQTTCPEGVQFCGGVGIIVNPGGTGGSSGVRCGNNITSCGAYPNCLDLSVISYCVNGKTVEPYCLNNQPQNRTKLGSTCSPTTDFKLEIKDHSGNDGDLLFSAFTPGSTNNPILTQSFHGNTTIVSALPIVDAQLDYDNSYLSILTKGTNLTKIKSAGSAKIIIEKVNANVPGATVYKTYIVELPNSYNFTSIILKIRYSDVTVTNESQLVFYRCANYNFATNNCDSGWELKANVTRNAPGKYVSLELSGFSAYALAEQGTGSTTTTTSTSTTTSSSSSSSTSSSSSSTSGSGVQSIYSTGGTSSSAVGKICSVNTDCCSGRTTGSYSCTPGGCVACDPSQAGCVSCETQQILTAESIQTTSTTTSTTEPTNSQQNQQNIFSFSFPSFSLPELTASSISISAITQNSALTFAVGFVAGFSVALFFKSGFSLPSFRPRYFGFPRGSRRYEGRYRSISHARNEAKRSRKFFGETRLILQ